ncbi:MAG: hypothetical protein JEZ06_15040 [Anaerolineaceae bacterium]|nr:hypothetical protein [Anaerolineaceae bacterium]
MSFLETGKIVLGVLTDPLEGWHPVELQEPGLDIIMAYALLKEVSSEDMKVTVLAAYVVSCRETVRIISDVDAIEFHVPDNLRKEITKIRNQLNRGYIDINVLGQKVCLPQVMKEANLLDSRTAA